MPADLDMRASDNLPFQVLAIAVGSAKKIILPPCPVEIRNLGYQDDDLTTVNIPGDLIVVMSSTATMVASLAAGRKLPIFPGESWEFDPDNLPVGADGPHEIQIQAVQSPARVLVIMGTSKRVYAH
jgi:hypothetical protein